MSVENFKLKKIPLLEWLKSRALRMSNADRDIEKENHKIYSGGNAKRYSCFERELENF